MGVRNRAFVTGFSNKLLCRIGNFTIRIDISFSGLTYIRKVGLVNFGRFPLKLSFTYKMACQGFGVSILSLFLVLVISIVFPDFLRGICSILCYKWGTVTFVSLNL